MSTWMIMDGRARTDMRRALVLETCQTKKEAKRAMRDRWATTGAVIVEWSGADDEFVVHEP